MAMHTTLNAVSDFIAVVLVDKDDVSQLIDDEAAQCPPSAFNRQTGCIK
jgi:hypothetical protein